MVRVQRGGQRLHTDAVDRECGGHGGGGAVDETFEKNKFLYHTHDVGIMPKINRKHEEDPIENNKRFGLEGEVRLGLRRSIH